MDYKALMIDSPQFLSVKANSSINSFEISFKLNFNLCGSGEIIVEGFGYTEGSGAPTIDNSFIQSVKVVNNMLFISIADSGCVPAEQLVTVIQPVTDGNIPISSMSIRANGYLKNGCGEPLYLDMPLFTVDISSLSGFQSPGETAGVFCSTCVVTNAEYSYNITLEFRCSGASDIAAALEEGIGSILCKTKGCATASPLSMTQTPYKYGIHVVKSWYSADQAAAMLRGISQDDYFQSKFGGSVCDPLISALSLTPVNDNCGGSGACTDFIQITLGSISFGGQAAISSLSFYEQGVILKFIADKLGMNMMDISVDFKSATDGTGGKLSVIYSKTAAEAAAANANATYYRSTPPTGSTQTGPLLATSEVDFQTLILGAIRDSKNISAQLAASYKVYVDKNPTLPLPVPSGVAAPILGGSCEAPQNLTFKDESLPAENVSVVFTTPAPTAAPLVAEIRFVNISQSTFFPCENNTIDVCFNINAFMKRRETENRYGQVINHFSSITISGFGGSFMPYSGVSGSNGITFASHDTNNLILNVDNLPNQTHCISFIVKNPDRASCKNLSIQAEWQNLNQTARDHLTPGQAGTVCDENANINLCSLSSVNATVSELTVAVSSDDPCRDNNVVVNFKLNTPLHSCKPGNLILQLSGLGNTLTPTYHDAANQMALRFNGLQVSGNFSSSDGLLRIEVPSSVTTAEDVCNVQNITFTMWNLNTSRTGAILHLDFFDAFGYIGPKIVSHIDKPPLSVQLVTLSAIMAQNSSWPGSLNMITVTLKPSRVLPVKCHTTLVINNLDGACFENECVGTGNLTLMGTSVFDAVWESSLVSDSTRSSVTLTVNQDVGTTEIFSFIIHNPVKSQGSPKVILTGHGVEVQQKTAEMNLTAILPNPCEDGDFICEHVAGDAAVLKVDDPMFLQTGVEQSNPYPSMTNTISVVLRSNIPLTARSIITLSALSGSQTPSGPIPIGGDSANFGTKVFDRETEKLMLTVSSTIREGTKLSFNFQLKNNQCGQESPAVCVRVSRISAPCNRCAFGQCGNCVAIA
eukprot:762954-Hanusia_phi.AAC.1